MTQSAAALPPLVGSHFDAAASRGIDRVLRQRYELDLPGHRRKLPIYPAIFGAFDPLAR